MKLTVFTLLVCGAFGLVMWGLTSSLHDKSEQRRLACERANGEYVEVRGHPLCFTKGTLK